MDMTGFAYGNCDELVGFISGKYGSSDFPFWGEAVLRFALPDEKLKFIKKMFDISENL